MSQNKAAKAAQPKQKSRAWLIILILVMMLALAGGMLARNFHPGSIDLSGMNIPLPQLPASNADLVSQAVTTYGQTNDLNHAEQLLSGMDKTEVARQLTQLEINTSDTMTRQSAAQLRRALGLSVVEPSAADLVLGQQGIWVTSALAALPFLAALAIGLGASVRTMVRTRLQEARISRSRKAAPVVTKVIQEVVEEQPVEEETTVKVVQAQTAPQAGGGEAQSAGGAAKAEAKDKDKPAEASKLNLGSDPMAEGEASAEMQSMLSDVFGDETQQTRRTVLLQGLDDIPAAQLLALCRQVADGLRLSRAGYRRPAALSGAGLAGPDTL